MEKDCIDIKMVHIILEGRQKTSKNLSHFFWISWQDDKPDGIGKDYYDDGTHFEGHFIKEHREGEGKIFDKQHRIIFEGYFVKNMKSGHGKCWNYDENGKNFKKKDFLFIFFFKKNGYFVFVLHETIRGKYSKNKKIGIHIIESLIFENKILQWNWSKL